ncbi:hypothetical protein A9W98_17950 [Mycobacterium gordonae]|uniref:Uncharacterized protein n=1 Tax=Mycobacterium gordonae TaxID=1778 RepID=A0A1A6BHN5_MYCGO|nr:hypothetical protein [Mycobacterium gordonae]OBS01867.1 hypothetical protein A9W98_17950 [Mycobacterium gordonae]
MISFANAAAFFPQQTRHSGAAAVLTAADNAAAETQRLQRFRAQVAELLGIPANAEDAFVLNEIEHMCRQVEEMQWERRGVEHG